MKIRHILIIAGFAILVGAVVGFKKLSGLKDTSQRKPPIATKRSAEYVEVFNDTIHANINITGKLVARDKIELFAEVNGTLSPSSSRFRDGNRFSQGAVLLSIDDSEQRLSVQSAKSNFLSTITRILPDLKLDYPDAFQAWKDYADDFSIDKKLNKLPEIKGSEKYFLSTQGVFNQYYSIRSQEARLAKYTILAPFSGTVSQAGIKPGTLVRAGQKLGEYIKTGVFEIEASIDLRYLEFVNIGSQVVLKSSQVNGSFEGKVVRVSDALDAATQSAKVIVEVEDKSLKEGMYLNGAIITEPFENAFVLTKNQVNANGEAFVIKDGKLQSREVHPLFIGENEIVTKELVTGEKILRSIYDGAFEGASVAIEGDKEASTAETPAKQD